MLSDESSSDSETGRFKCRSKNQAEQTKSTNATEDKLRHSARSTRPSENDRFRREFERKRDERDRFERRSRERHRYSRYSPVRRRHSRERSPNRRRSRERERERERTRHHEEMRSRSKPREHRSNSRDRRRHSRSRSHKSQEIRKDPREDVKKATIEEKTLEKIEKVHKHDSPPDYRSKRSEIHKPTAKPDKKRSDSPIIVEDHGDTDASEEVKPGSYYSMIPAVVKEKSEESSEIDSSDDEKLRAKLLNLEKELHKTKKKKHKKKHKRKTSKSSKDTDREPTTVEVSSTTDIEEKSSKPFSQTEPIEVTSTQKSIQKESSEEGELSSDDDSSQEKIEIDPSDLRHKLSRSIRKVDITKSSSDICGPALPPHLQERYKRSKSRDMEGPTLPPHLQAKSKHMGPAIPDDMRKVLAEKDQDIILYASSDEDASIGPLPAGTEDRWSEGHKRLEERALEMKIRTLDAHSMKKSNVKSREQWMLELPEAKAKILGLEPRSFRAKEGPDMSDRSSWTDTPEEKARKAAGVKKEEDGDAELQREARARHIAFRDEEQDKAAKKHKKKHKREESLLEIHQKKLKKKKKNEDKDEEKKERRPFSRDVDLQVNRFDEAQKKSIIKKAQDLNSRFSRGEAKYL